VLCDLIIFVLLFPMHGMYFLRIAYECFSFPVNKISCIRFNTVLIDICHNNPYQHPCIRYVSHFNGMLHSVIMVLGNAAVTNLHVKVYEGLTSGTFAVTHMHARKYGPYPFLWKTSNFDHRQNQNHSTDRDQTWHALLKSAPVPRLVLITWPVAPGWYGDS
jgi:hypothetical protein